MSEQNAAGTSRGTAIFGMLIAFFGGYFLGVFTSGEDRSASLTSEARKAERKLVALGTSPAVGPPTAPVTVVEYADFLCGHCARSVRLKKRLRAEFQDKVRWVFKPYPLSTKPGSSSVLAAKAALAAGAQGKFWEYHDRLFSLKGRPGREELEALARELGLDQERFEAVLEDPILERSLLEEQQRGRDHGVQGTPTFFINGRRIVGSIPYPDLEQVVRQELALAGELLRQGVARDRLYEEIAGMTAKQQGPAAPQPQAAPDQPPAPADQPAAAQPAS